MFTYVKAKNFKSLKDIEFDLRKTKTNINNFVAIYGENGSGKTNIVELFKFLQELVLARFTDTAMAKLPEDFWKIPERIKNDFLMDVKHLFQFSLNLSKYRMINEKSETELEYGFEIDGKKGFYSIKFADEIVEEKLYYMVNKQRGYLFEVVKEENRIIKILNDNIFLNSKYNEELIETIDKYWGKYSFLSLILFEFKEKNKEYMDNSVSENVMDVLEKFITMTVHVDDQNFRMLPDRLVKTGGLNNIQSGVIKRENLDELKKYENILDIFFTQAYPDIKNVKYLLEEKEEEIKYELTFEKMIANELREISYRLESSGTRRILTQFNTLIRALVGETVIIDEIDNGIHDVLIKNIIMSIKDEITGQLIITTHNTLLLEVLPKENIYVISTDYNGNKLINSIKDFGIKIQKNNNVRDLYFKGVFGGIPLIDYIDFEEIKYALEDIEKEEDVYSEET